MLTSGGFTPGNLVSWVERRGGELLRRTQTVIYGLPLHSYVASEEQVSRTLVLLQVYRN